MESRVTGWRLHDLRRSLATNLQKLKIRLEVTEAVLNHVGSRAGIVGVYQKYGYDTEKRHALEAWSERLRSLLAGKETPSNVVEMAGRRA
jgi:hypothetical protein